MNESLVEDVMKIRGVKGAALANAMGEITVSTVERPELNEFIGFLSGIAPVLGNSAGLGAVRGVTLKSTKGDNLSVFIEGDEALGVVSTRETATRFLRQQVDDLLQWG